MNSRTLFFLLEERSAQEALQVIIPRLVPGVNVHYIIFEGKRDLDKRVGRKIQDILTPNSCFFILSDQDQEDCVTLKTKLIKKIPDNKRDVTLMRIACKELESFYLGDLKAVQQGMNLRGIEGKQERRKYRNPDKLSNAKQELRKLTKNKYQPLSGSRKIASALSLDESNRSHSFNMLVAGIRKLVHQPPKE